MAKFKRNRIDVCNICRKTKELTWDHVPPKGGITLSSVEIDTIYKKLDTEQDTKKVLSQNGVKYRTVCSGCNSQLGLHFDPVLNEFNKTVALFLKSKLILPAQLSVKTKPIRLMKAVLGHLLSAKTEIDNSKLDHKIRILLASDLADFPEDIHIFYWIYPYNVTVIMRDFMTLNIARPSTNIVFLNVIKYFPIAFLVTDSTQYEGLDDVRDLSVYKSLGIDDEAEVIINLRTVKAYNFPEAVDNHTIVFMSQESQAGIIATPRPSNRSSPNNSQ